MCEKTNCANEKERFEETGYGDFGDIGRHAYIEIEEDGYEYRPKIRLQHEPISIHELIGYMRYVVRDVDNLRILLEIKDYLDAKRWNIFYSLTEELNEIYQEMLEDLSN